ncbi:hypothetical protein AHAS_Ahas15G0195300 [Arachis hypogaea]
MIGAREELEKQEKEALIPSEIPMKKEEVVRVYKPRAPYPQRLLRVTKEHANSLRKKVMQDLTKESEKNNQGSPHSNEVESCIEDGLIEPPIQEILDEEDTPTITQHLKSCNQGSEGNQGKHSKKDCDQETKKNIHEK